jgi:hypothetical protein
VCPEIITIVQNLGRDCIFQPDPDAVFVSVAGTYPGWKSIWAWQAKLITVRTVMEAKVFMVCV